MSAALCRRLEFFKIAFFVPDNLFFFFFVKKYKKSPKKYKKIGETCRQRGQVNLRHVTKMDVNLFRKIKSP